MSGLEPDTIRTWTVSRPAHLERQQPTGNKRKNLIGWTTGIPMEAPNRTHPDSAARHPSGFGADLHVRVLHSVLRRQGRILVITACPPEVRRITHETALARNRLILDLASEIAVPYLASGSPCHADRAGGTCPALDRFRCAPGAAGAR